MRATISYYPPSLQQDDGLQDWFQVEGMILGYTPDASEGEYMIVWEDSDSMDDGEHYRAIPISWLIDVTEETVNV